MKHSKVPGVVKIISLIFHVIAILSLIFGALLVAKSFTPGIFFYIEIWAGALLLVSGIITLYAASILIKGENHARIIIIIVSILGIFQAGGLIWGRKLTGTVILIGYLFTIYYLLFNKEVKKFFGKEYKGNLGKKKK